MADLSDSYEAQMLQSLKREAQEEGDTSSGDDTHSRPGVSGENGQARVIYRDDDIDSSSSDDTDMSTLKGPVSVILYYNETSI